LSSVLFSSFCLIHLTHFSFAAATPFTTRTLFKRNKRRHEMRKTKIK
jgi:hypothetical protein